MHGILLSSFYGEILDSISSNPICYKPKRKSKEKHIVNYKYVNHLIVKVKLLIFLVGKTWIRISSLAVSEK